MLTSFVLMIVALLVFLTGFLNAYHDTFYAVEIPVSVKAIQPFFAILWFAFFNTLAYLAFRLEIVSILISILKNVPTNAIMSALIASLVGRILTFFTAFRADTNFLIIGGLSGAMLGANCINPSNIAFFGMTLSVLFFMPFIGICISWIMGVVCLHIIKNINVYKLDRFLKRAILFSTAGNGFAYGLNESQKMMGLMTATLLIIAKTQSLNSDAFIVFDGKGTLVAIPNWISIMAYLSITLGILTASIKVFKNSNPEIAKITPFEGFMTQSFVSIMLIAGAKFGVLLSNHQLQNSGIIGLKFTKRIYKRSPGGILKNLYNGLYTFFGAAVLSLFFYYILSIL